LTWLGWRSPLRTTAMREIQHGVRGDSTVWQTATGTRLLSLRETLQQMPATVQERWFARLFLLKPMLVLTLAAFWCATAVIAIANPRPALSLLAVAGIEGIAAQAVVFGGAAVDALLGLAVLHRRSLRAAALAMVAVTVGYLVGGTLLLPSLWLDPLGPLVKPIPAAVLALVLLAIADDR
ncbi:MAG TPA: DoxX-like family protein, partial [Casimicrobium huifangae]|nr:DoxX-like family protein [Casimicrobium huifangae]